MVHTGYDGTLVGLSIAIAVLASYTALDLGGRVRGAAAAARWAWVGAASLAMGGGIWSMHFVGMLAFQMAMRVTYDVRLTLLSLLIAVGATGAAFAWVGRRGARVADVFLSGPLMGAGVAAMHYTGMAAMEIPGHLAYSGAIVTVSVLIAVTAATAALWLTFRQNNVWQKLLAAGIMGLAVAGMHYTGMAAAVFTAAMPVVDPGSHDGGLTGIGQQNLALYVAGATFLILFLAMLASSIDQQRVQRALYASEERFRAAAEASGHIIWTNDADGQMRGSQPDWQKFTGQSEAECQGHGWAAAVHPEDVAPTIAEWNAATSERRTFLFEHRVRRHDGVYCLCSIRAVPVLNQGGPIREWVGVHEDITARREAEIALRTARDAAEQASHAKSQFLANMSHELRTPLSAIIGYSEMLEEEIRESGNGAGVLQDLQKIETNARHLLGLINDVLDISKVESGKVQIDPERFDVAAVLRDLATSLQSLVVKKRNTLTLALAPDLGAADQDLTKLRQVLLNLISNAAKFTENGRITLSVRRASSSEGDRIVLRVSDTGIGMSEEHMARLFQRFQQADNSTTRRFGGSGLGLYLTKALIDMLGGTIAVESALGHGTTFTVALPARYAPPRRQSLVDDAGEGASATTPPWPERKVDTPLPAA